MRRKKKKWYWKKFPVQRFLIPSIFWLAVTKRSPFPPILLSFFLSSFPFRLFFNLLFRFPWTLRPSFLSTPSFPSLSYPSFLPSFLGLPHPPIRPPSSERFLTLAQAPLFLLLCFLSSFPSVFHFFSFVLHPFSSSFLPSFSVLRASPHSLQRPLLLSYFFFITAFRLFALSSHLFFR